MYNIIKKMSIFGEKIKEKLGSENVFFDYIDGMPIRCFYKPIISKRLRADDLIAYSYGENRVFNVGDALPINTMWYNYPENLMILNLKDGKYKSHIIKKGVFLYSKDVSNISDDVFCGIDAVINSDGDFININSYKDIELYIKDMNEYKEIVNDLESYNDYLIGKLNATYTSLRILSSATVVKSLFSFIDSNDIDDINKYLNRRFMTKNMSIFEIKSFLLLNEFIFNKADLTMLKNILRKKYELLYIDLDIEFEEHFNFYEKQVTFNRDDLEKKWIVKIGFEKEKRLGELLECLRWSIENRDDYFLTTQSMDAYFDFSMKEIKKLLKDNVNLICKYKEWSSFFKNNEFKVNSILEIIENYEVNSIKK